MRTDRTVAQYRDSAGRTLTDYPRPSVAVDTALLTVLPEADQLSVLQVRRVNRAGWGLPGTFLHPGERLIEAVQRSLREKAGVQGAAPLQLHVFDDPDRDDRGWVLSVAHLDIVPSALLDGRNAATTRLVPVAKPGRLPYGHESIVEMAVRRVRDRYAGAPDPAGLLSATFTIRDLHRLHEAVAGHSLQRVTFRRIMQPQLVATGERSAGGPGKPAELFERAG